MASPTRARTQHWCQARFSIAILPPVARFTVTHIADPGIDLFATAKRLQDPLVFLKGIELAAHWTDKGLPVFNNEFHTIAGREADALTDFLRYGDRKSTRLNSSHTVTSYAVFCLKTQRASTIASSTT